MDPESHVYVAQRFLSQTQVGDYELVDNHPHLATPHSPSTPDLLYPHTHLTATPAPPHLPINQNGLPVLEASIDRRRPGDLDLDLERQHALFYSSDLLNSNVSADMPSGLDDNLSHVGSADHLIHGGHFLSELEVMASSFSHYPKFKPEVFSLGKGKAEPDRYDRRILGGSHE